ncbi:hypothetical protein K402DRAFT_453295 [Aulographum hederae CBS 113979]|uniref:Conserved oligomeric Golgi complex subunit 5 n=1 Tax=Aulographum hederae CBS 113979 TaxID=1176131 RepID=A0A6G1H3Q8_9PEZI|nr:hypothetical protein K402DRAFT_453295 [Aulographum hederae CBS 113979]
MADEDGPSYIDYEAFLDPSFSPTAFANTLVLATNNPSDTPLDLSTPLSRVLFDVQEVDTHIDTLSTRSALPLIEYSKDTAAASSRILSEVEAQVASLTESYKALEKEVVDRYEAAAQVQIAAERLCQTLKLGRAVGRCLTLGRQLELQVSEINGSASNKRGDHRAMVRSSNTLLSVRQLLAALNPGDEGEGLNRINVINTLKTDFLGPTERNILNRSQQIVREFSMSSLLASNASGTGSGAQSGAPSTFAQTEDTKSRATSALLTLYLLSPPSTTNKGSTFDAALLVSSLQDYLRTALKSSLAALARALATLPTLDRTLLEVSARCQNIVALEALLESIKPPPHFLLESSTLTPPSNFLQPLLQSLDTSSLPSYFWRSLASSLSARVQEILSKGGVSARTLRSNKERVRDSIRTCVSRGSKLPANASGRGKEGKAQSVGNWEREAAVMVQSVMGPLGR